MMEFLNSNLKKGPKGKGRNGKATQEITPQQYQQFVNNAIQRGRGGGGGGKRSLNGVGILQALQNPGRSEIEDNPLGNFFQKLSIKKENNVMPMSHEEMKLKLNKEALLRLDPAFSRLIGSASQVAVYDYAAETGDWVDVKIVGCLFLYSRTCSPEYGLVVLNRKGMKNLVMLFDKKSQVVPHDPYLLFRRGPDEVIKCIWFYKETEFHEATQLFRAMGVQFDQCDSNVELASSNSQATDSSSTDLSVNLFSMLQQSQKNVAGASCNMGSTQKVFTAEQLEQEMFEDTTSHSNSTHSQGGLNIDPYGGNGFSSGKNLLNQLTGFSAANPTGNVRKTVKNHSGDSSGDSLPSYGDACRSMKTVEQLEKVFTPAEEASNAEMSNELLATLGIKPIKDGPESISEICTPQSPFLTPTSRSISDSERSQRKLTIDDLDGKLYDETEEEEVREVVENLTDLTELLLLSENVAGHAEPQLVWRKRSNLQNRPTSAVLQIPPFNGLGSGVIGNSTGIKQIQPRHLINDSPSISPLTQSQLTQALTYLLQTDASFIEKIHEAYVKSLQQSLTNRFN